MDRHFLRPHFGPGFAIDAFLSGTERESERRSPSYHDIYLAGIFPSLLFCSFVSCDWFPACAPESNWFTPPKRLLSGWKWRWNAPKTFRNLFFFGWVAVWLLPENVIRQWNMRYVNLYEFSINLMSYFWLIQRIRRVSKYPLLIKFNIFLAVSDFQNGSKVVCIDLKKATALPICIWNELTWVTEQFLRMTFWQFNF